ncbi:helix-turn-helix domain-containing protein [filamentous cyanobacterium LEGE 11480]|uniref:Helix-turn-helix domain-containing protein n=1 Tax=Romeriopsis navalis LEGE 11480 TaxID=2777977 RepID=A0A928Z0H5_9CYAN|nr:RodZ domain-containing protein [Romeriopsis navalis]MBE9028276.1 helix-turn-helix domain-containing protein [Romeriopsis navalis LEGE 11480]
MNKQALQIKELQALALKDIGLKLVHTREQREFSVEDLAVKTHIPARLLRSLENSDLSQLPEPVYIQSFIRQYANSLGLNGVQLASEFPVEPVVRSPRKIWLKRPKLQLRPVHLYGAYALLIVGAVQGLSVVLNQSARQFPTLPNAPRVTPQNLPIEANQVAVGPNQPAVAQAQVKVSASSKPVRVDLTLTDSSWVKFVVDGKNAYEGTMEAGEKRVLTADQKVTVIAGNAGGVIATFNGGQAKPLGAPGSVQEVSFPPEAGGMADAAASWVARHN